jgi:hypothetical protein
MGNRCLYKAKRYHMLGTAESGRLKVAALNLFHPTASPLSKGLVFLYHGTVCWCREKDI